MQKQDSLPLSMMCDRDRNVTYIPKTQPGFIAFASLPLMTVISTIVPETLFIREQLLRNKEQWEENPDFWEPGDVYQSASKGLLALDTKLWN